MIFHLALNTLFVFFILAAIVEGLLFICSIQNCRIRYLLRTLPLLKVPFDFAVFFLYGESFFHNFNPFSCELEFQDLIISILPSSIQAKAAPNNHLLIPNYLASMLSPAVLQLLMIVLSVSSAILFLGQTIRLISYRIYFKKTLKNSEPFKHPIRNRLLEKELKSQQVKLMLTLDGEVPFAAGKNHIFIPKAVHEHLSQDEIEAIISHELEHLSWKDPIFKALFSIICAVLWWIPTDWWLRRMEKDQEQASDSSVYRFGIDPLILAEAIVKAIKFAKKRNREAAPFCYLDSGKGSHIQRIEKLTRQMEPENSEKSLLAFVFCILASLSFWLC